MNQSVDTQTLCSRSVTVSCTVISLNRCVVHQMSSQIHRHIFWFAVELPFQPSPLIDYRQLPWGGTLSRTSISAHRALKTRGLENVFVPLELFEHQYQPATLQNP